MAYNAGAASGNLVLLSSQTASASSGLTFTSLISSQYDDYVIKYSGITGAGGIGLCVLQYSTDNGATYLNGANYSTVGWDASGGGGTFRSLTLTHVRLNGGGIPAAPGQCAGTCQLFNIVSGTFYPVSIVSSMSTTGITGLNYYTEYATAIAVNAFQIIPDAGTFSGTFKLYGVQN